MSREFKPRGQSRRQVLVAGAALAALSSSVRAETISGKLPWAPGAASPPQPVDPNVWKFFTPEEVSAVEALVERLIPPDPQTPGGKEAGCAVFIDGQLAGPYGAAEGLYMEGPFAEGTPQQGLQSQATPAQTYRAALKSLDAYVRAHFAGKSFAALAAADQDAVMSGLDHGTVALDGVNGKRFFDLLLQNTMEGFFADPLYGGNRNMVGWKMVGFPGAHYDYRDYVEQHNRKLELEPISILSRL
jgi:gluconate 2-dehydrogenase gamma chain